MKSPSLSGFARRLRREWRVLDLPHDGKTVVVAVSGGADSCALLAALHELKQAKKLDLNFIVGHFNHNLRGAESERDAEFVQKLAMEFGFQIEMQTSMFPLRNLKGNLEQTARDARYDFLIRAAEKTNAFAVLTAHTLNDQAETFLLRLARGGGIDGLGAMNAIRQFEKKEICEREKKNISPKNLASGVLLIRPLLNWARREMTEEYCRAREIEFRNDSMNEDLNFARVRVRRELIPLLETFNSNIVEQIAQTARLMRADADELNCTARQLFESSINDSLVPALKVDFLRGVSVSLRRRVLRMWLKNNRNSLKRITAKHLTALEKLLLSGQGGSFVEFPGGGIAIKKGNLILYERQSS